MTDNKNAPRAKPLTPSLLALADEWGKRAAARRPVPPVHSRGIIAGPAARDQGYFDCLQSAVYELRQVIKHRSKPGPETAKPTETAEPLTGNSTRVDGGELVVKIRKYLGYQPSNASDDHARGGDLLDDALDGLERLAGEVKRLKRERRLLHDTVAAVISTINEQPDVMVSDVYGVLSRALVALGSHGNEVLDD